MSPTTPHRHTNRRVIGRLAPALTIPVLAAGCASARSAVPTQHTTPASARPQLSAEPGHTSGAVRIPAVNFRVARSVATAFYVSWASYDTRHEAPGAFVVRVRRYATPHLARELAENPPAQADWAAKHRRDEASRVRVTALKHPDGAPAPTANRVVLRVYADRTTTTDSVRKVTPDGATLVVRRYDGRWLVDAILFV